MPMIPLFLELTSINRNPVYINMGLVHKISKSDNYGSVLYIGENTKQFVMESPDLIMQLMYPRVESALEDEEDDEI